MKAGEIWIQYLLSLVPDGEWQHITFTLPCEFWTLIYHNRWLLAADVVLESGRRAGLLPGGFAVIHTWGRDQQWHPHIHLSTTAGGVTDDNVRIPRNRDRQLCGIVIGTDARTQSFV